MPLSSTVVWEVRATGSAANGAAFRAGATGTDYSQQDAPQVSYTDLTVDASVNTKVTSAASPFTAAHVGNLINISSSTGGWTAGYYEVMSVASGAATLDRSPAATGTTGGVGKLGGASDSPNTIQNAVVNSNVVWIKQGTYAAVNAFFNLSNNSVSATSPTTRLCGYGTTRGDNGRPTLVGVSGSPVVRVGNGWSIANLILDGSASSSYGLQAGSSEIVNCKVLGGTNIGITTTINSVIMGCEVTGGGFTGSTTIGIGPGSSSTLIDCYVHDRNGIGIQTGNGATVISCVIANCTSDGVQLSGTGVAFNNTIYGCGGNGIARTDSQGRSYPILNNILASNGGYGIIFATSAGARATLQTDGNAFYNNTSGTRLNGNDTTVNPQNASGAYVNTCDKILTASPFVNAGAADFRLNNTAGGGALCRGTGVPTTWPGLAVSGYTDFGAIEHQDSGGGSGGRCVIGSPIIKSSRRMD